MIEIYTFIYIFTWIPLFFIVIILWTNYTVNPDSMDIETKKKLRLKVSTFTLALLLYSFIFIPIKHTKWYQEALIDYTARTELRHEKRNKERINDYKTFRAQVDSVKNKYTKTDTKND